MENKQIIGILAHNHPGVLLRITSLISRRGFNIDSLTASPSGIEGFSRLTVRMSGDDAQVEQFINQLMKIVDVKKAEVLPEETSVAMELILMIPSMPLLHQADVPVEQGMKPSNKTGTKTARNSAQKKK